MFRPFRALAVVLTLALAVGGCKCGPGVNAVLPALLVTPNGLDFGKVKVGSSLTVTLKLESTSRIDVKISAVGVTGDAAFTAANQPITVASLGEGKLDVTFSPTERKAYAAELAITSDDGEKPVQKFSLVGEGVHPLLVVTPDCAVSRKCEGSVVVTPPSITFAPEPFLRLLPVDVSTLPSVNIVNEGQVDLKVTKISIAGADATAFTFAGNAMIPTEGLLLEAAAGRNLAIQFKPTSEAKQTYSAKVVIESDDPDHAVVEVALNGTLRPNLAPKACVNLVRVVPTDDSPRDYSAKALWDLLLIPPAGGYDFSTTRDVEPRAEAVFSAISNAADQTVCTSDPEDGRIGLKYQWTLTTSPPGAATLGLSGATTSQVSLRPIVTGEYQLQLSVKDTQGHETLVPVKFSVAVKNDLVAQLQWTNFSGVDLDVHLVRPSAVTTPSDPFSGVFSFFEENGGFGAKTAGDINGFARTVYDANKAAGFAFDWGDAGTIDDPRLNFDDTGASVLVENVSLNKPENDAKCATGTCSYKVLVHYFKDERTDGGATACFVDGGPGCLDGEACACTGGARCVADSAPPNDAGTGIGRCLVPPKPVVRIFLKGSAVPAKVIPLEGLMPADDLAIGAPCHMLYVADVQWPSKQLIGSLADGGTPLATISVKGANDAGYITPVIGRYGFRQAGGSLQCSPNTVRGATNIGWYSRTP